MEASRDETNAEDATHLVHTETDGEAASRAYSTTSKELRHESSQYNELNDDRDKKRPKSKRKKPVIAVEHVSIIENGFWERYPWILEGKSPQLLKP